MSSGDEIEAGRVTTAESTTDLLGAVPSEQDVDFNGPVILRVAPQPGPLAPSHDLDGIHGVGHNRVISAGGTGIVGFGGQHQGTGVAGLGGGIDGHGGIGVLGTGGGAFGQVLGPPPEDRAGPGVVGQGGRMNENVNARRRAHGAGVIGVAGGSARPVPSPEDTGSVGVYAQGADAEVHEVKVSDDNSFLVGPIAPGPGVLGRGGVPIPRKEEPVAAGVIGLAGDIAIPPIAESGNVGVYGAGSIGLKGIGSLVGVEGRSKGAGVSGLSSFGPGVGGVGRPGVAGTAADDSSRGGTFASRRSAQLQLVPHRLPERIPNQVNVTPTGIPPASAPALPRDGHGGDLMVIEMDTEDKQRFSTLWFCVQGARGAGAARWAQVLVGQPFDGRK